MRDYTILQTIEQFAPDSLYIVVKDNRAYIVDATCEDQYLKGMDSPYDEEPDYAVFTSIPVDDLKKGQTTEDIIPDFYADSHFNFLENDDFPNYYNLPQYIIEEVAKMPYSDWAEFLRKHGYNDVADEIQNECDAFRTDGQFKPMTDEEIDKLRVPNKTVDRYIEWLNEERETDIEKE